MVVCIYFTVIEADAVINCSITSSVKTYVSLNSSLTVHWMCRPVAFPYRQPLNKTI